MPEIASPNSNTTRDGTQKWGGRNNSGRSEPGGWDRHSRLHLAWPQGRPRVPGRGAAGSSTNVDMSTALRGHQFIPILYTYLSLLSLFLSLVYGRGVGKREKDFEFESI